jgi:hypothetical protein
MRDSKRQQVGTGSPLPQLQPLALRSHTTRRGDMTVCLDVVQCPPGAQPDSLQVTPPVDQQHTHAGATPAAFARHQIPNQNDTLILPEDDGTRVMTRTRRKSLRMLNADQDTVCLSCPTDNIPPANGVLVVRRYALPQESGSHSTPKKSTAPLCCGNAMYSIHSAVDL